MEVSLAVFITASGTEIGKTHTACGLIAAAQAANLPVLAVKPVVSGITLASPGVQSSDPARLLQSMQREITSENLKAIAPWHFRAPLSPPSAAAREGQSLNLGQIVEWVQQQHHSFSQQHQGKGLFIVEGAGGVMAPLTQEGHTMLDWMKQLKMPVALVTGSYLGSISHTLTAYQCLKQESLDVRAVVLSESPENPMALTETAQSLQQHISTPIRILERCDDSMINSQAFAALLKDITA